jgi:hypothetical protein
MILQSQVVQDDMPAGVGRSKCKWMKPEDLNDSVGFEEQREQWLGVEMSQSCEGIQ